MNTRTIHVHIRTMSLAKLLNCCVSKTINSKAFKLDDMYVSIGTRMFANCMKSVRANYSMICNMSYDLNKCLPVPAKNMC